MYEALNLGNDENPHLIKIGCTLNEPKKKDLKELLTELLTILTLTPI